MNPFKLFDPSYLFETRPGSEFMFFWPLLVIFVAIFAGSFNKKVKNFASAMRWFSFIGLCLTFTRDQNIPYLGMRLWFVVLFLAAVAYGIYAWKQMNKKAEMKPVKEAKKAADKYLPKKKRKSKKGKR
jgi:phosphotransferase system  glucose/maltose/N-acetylglucosamine-specific IIC component